MSEDVAMVELVPDVELGALVARVTPYPELDPGGFEQAVADADTALRAGDYDEAVEDVQALLGKLVRDIAYELRRPPGESLEVFWARRRPEGDVQQHRRFLMHKCFLNEREAQRVERATTITETPGVETGVSPAVWSRLVRQMVYAVAERLITRYATWQAGCSCEAGEAVKLVVLQPPGDGPKYERAICRRCRCPREVVPATEAAAAEAMPATEGPVVQVKLLVAGGPGVEVTPTVAPASVG